jgi:hypothetical protein
MNNLIVGTPRSGTFNLYNSIVANPNQKGWSEPFFNTGIFDTQGHITFKKFKSFVSKTNFCVKTISIQFPSDIDSSKYIEYYEELFSLFDNIIILDRKDTKDHFKSYCNLVTKAKQQGTKHVNDFYTFTDDMITLDEIDSFVRSKIILHRVAQEFNKEVFYYEDLYLNNTQDTYKKMNLNYTKASAKFLDSNQKYRRDSSKKTLI